MNTSDPTNGKFAPWKGLQVCESIEDCTEALNSIHNTTSTLSISNYCVKLNYDSFSRFCICEPGFGGEACSELTLQAYPRLRFSAVLLPVLSVLTIGVLIESCLSDTTPTRKSLRSAIQFSAIGQLANTFGVLLDIVIFASNAAPKLLIRSMEDTIVLPLVGAAVICSLLVVCSVWNDIFIAGTMQNVMVGGNHLQAIAIFVVISTTTSTIWYIGTTIDDTFGWVYMSLCSVIVAYYFESSYACFKRAVSCHRTLLQRRNTQPDIDLVIAKSRPRRHSTSPSGAGANASLPPKTNEMTHVNIPGRNIKNTLTSSKSRRRVSDESTVSSELMAMRRRQSNQQDDTFFNMLSKRFFDSNASKVKQDRVSVSLHAAARLRHHLIIPLILLIICPFGIVLHRRVFGVSMNDNSIDVDGILINLIMLGYSLAAGAITVYARSLRALRQLRGIKRRKSTRRTSVQEKAVIVPVESEVVASDRIF